MVYHPRVLRLLALSQMIMGALMIVFGIAGIFAVHHWSSYVGFGIWVGVWVLVTGILGYVGARYDTSPNKCLIGIFMGFAITSIVLAGVMVICYGIALAQFSERLNPFYRRYYYPDYFDIEYYTAKNGAGIGSCLLILAVVDFFVALMSSVYCCNAVCCGDPVQSGVAVQNQQVVYMQQQPSHPSQVVVMNPASAAPPSTLPTVQTYPTSQPMYYQGQPTYYVTASGVPVSTSSAGGAVAPMVVTSQPGQPMYWGNPAPAPVGAIPTSTAAGAGVTTQPAQPAQPVQWGAAAQVPAQGTGGEMPPPYKQ